MGPTQGRAGGKVSLPQKCHETAAWELAMTSAARLWQGCGRKIFEGYQRCAA
jgi:hypothetical protein